MKLFKHLKTVHNHRKAVRKLCFKCGLYWQGLTHDLSKYSLAELIPSVKYWTGKRAPSETEIEAQGFSQGWLHHMHRNRHHFEFWVDLAHGRPYLICEMPLKYLAESFCDRVGAAKVYLGDKYTDASAYQYLLNHGENTRRFMGPKSYNILLHWVIDLMAYGEEHACAEIRKALKEDKK